jgi:hypothetical protein
MLRIMEHLSDDVKREKNIIERGGIMVILSGESSEHTLVAELLMMK